MTATANKTKTHETYFKANAFRTNSISDYMDIHRSSSDSLHLLSPKHITRPYNSMERHHAIMDHHRSILRFIPTEQLHTHTEAIPT